MSANNGRLRFACLVRVSTDRQSQQGQSLITQRKEAVDNVPALGGRIAGWYGGSEHATPGHEHAEVNRLLADAAKGNIDAVHVSHCDRWSRDNGKSKVGLDILRKHKVRFFVCKQEYNLHDPTACLFLGMSAEIGEFQAGNQSKKSMINRIERARKGLPVSGKLPFGRTFDKKAGAWGIDPAKHALVKDCARRYLRGEGMAALAKEYDLNLSTLHEVLTRRCGPSWVQNFDSDKLNIHEQVPTRVPELLPADTIALIHKKTEENRTYLRGQQTNSYLLSRMVFCGKCGRAMFGQGQYGFRYYRHALERTPLPGFPGGCDGKLSWPRADRLEQIVLYSLFDLFGNASRVAAAIREASPDTEQIAHDRQRLERLTADKAKIETQRQRIVEAVAEGTLTKDQVAKKMSDLDAREQAINEQLDTLAATLANVPSAQDIKAFAEKVTKRRVRVPLHKLVHSLSKRDVKGMSYTEQRDLMQMVFGGKAPDGKRLGVYVEWQGKEWKYRILGRLIDTSGRVPTELLTDDPVFLGGPRQDELLAEVGSSAKP
jgi:DNA invertase Pin-like site-specific DNA recombinase